MKKLIIINGTMGAGKSTVSNLLLKMLDKSVYLDGDWCWNMNPFIVTDENKNMVMDNITYLLKSFLHNSNYEYIIFCWVIQDEDIFKLILDKLKGFDFELYKISLICSEDALRKRLEKDVQSGVRKPDVIERSIKRIALYDKMDTIKIDVSRISAFNAAQKIYELVNLKSRKH